MRRVSEESREHRVGAITDLRTTPMAWRTYDFVAGEWDVMAATDMAEDCWRRHGGHWVIEALNERGRLLRQRTTVILHELVPLHVSPPGDRIGARLYAADPHLVVGGWLQLVLLVAPAGRPGAAADRSTDPGVREAPLTEVAQVGEIVQPFAASGLVDIDVPVSALGCDEPLHTTGRVWPPHLRRLSVVVPEAQVGELQRARRF